jgi:hypothetical protein
MEYSAVDPNGLCEKDGTTKDSSVVPEVKPALLEQLALVRQATEGAVVHLTLESFGEAFEGLELLQLWGALLFQIAARNISKVSCGWPRHKPEELAEWTLKLLEDVLDSACLPEPDFEGMGTITMYGDPFDTSYNGSTNMHKLAWTNNCRLLKRYGSELGVEDRLSGDEGGLHDEDTQGEYTPLHVAAYKGNVEAFTLLADELGADVNAKSFDGGNVLHLAASQGHNHIVAACLTRGVKLDAQIYKFPGWQSNMMATAGFTAIHTVCKYRVVSRYEIYLPVLICTTIPSSLSAPKNRP